jgi:hypothetical protein
MPYKNKDDKLEWQREYNKRNPDKVKAWEETKRAKRMSRVKPSGISEKRQARLNALEAKSEQARIAAIPVEVARACEIIRRRIMVRDGLARCCYCKEIKPKSDVKIKQPGSPYGECRDCRSKKQKAYNTANPEKKQACNKRSYMAIRSNPAKLIKTRIRQRIQQAIRNIGVGVAVRSGKFRYLGCTGEEAACYLQQQFKGCMSWDNYGTAWHIDHVFPLASYDLSQEEERAKAFHYTNLQPLWARSNIKKSDHMPNKPHQPRLLLA